MKFPVCEPKMSISRPINTIYIAFLAFCERIRTLLEITKIVCIILLRYN